jgi:uncharacterized protein (DUF3084 family)
VLTRSLIKLEQLERENKMFQDELRARANNTKNSSKDSPIQQEGLLLSDEEERIYLTQELDQARRELTKFRKEMDGLSAQLNDMASEMVLCITYCLLPNAHLFET